jgi:predicted lipoprotein with Yx(FWY)xxD motif
VATAAPTTKPTSPTSAITATTAHVETPTGPLGTYLTDGAGRTLYMFAADGRSKSNCSDWCRTYRPPLTAEGTPAARGSAKTADLGTIARSRGARQVTYAGRPLYYYVGNHEPGDTAGQHRGRR